MLKISHRVRAEGKAHSQRAVAPHKEVLLGWHWELTSHPLSFNFPVAVLHCSISRLKREQSDEIISRFSGSPSELPTTLRWSMICLLHNQGSNSWLGSKKEGRKKKTRKKSR